MNPFKNVRHTLFQAALMITLVAGLSACGKAQRPVSETLPNKMVPVDTLVDDPVSEATPTPAPHASRPAIHVASTPNQRVHSGAPDDFVLADKAIFLGALDQQTYLQYQKKWVGSTYPACNFFVITALCEAGYCQSEKPFYKAADFDLYFMQQGWSKISLPELKQLFINHEKFDAVLQKHGVTADEPGHIMVAVGYKADLDEIVVAEGSLGDKTNQVIDASDWFIQQWNGGFTIFVRR